MTHLGVRRVYESDFYAHLNASHFEYAKVTATIFLCSLTYKKAGGLIEYIAEQNNENSREQTRFCNVHLPQKKLLVLDYNHFILSFFCHYQLHTRNRTSIRHTLHIRVHPSCIPAWILLNADTVPKRRLNGPNRTRNILYWNKLRHNRVNWVVPEFYTIQVNSTNHTSNTGRHSYCFSDTGTNSHIPNTVTQNVHTQMYQIFLVKKEEKRPKPILKS